MRREHLVSWMAIMSVASAAQSALAQSSGCSDDRLRINQILAVGSHNSYKLAIAEPEMKLLRDRSPETALTLDYAHPPLEEQLERGARQLELDVYADAEGGRFANPLGPRLAGGILPAEWKAELSRPGFKVLHATEIDFRSSCLRFVTCLERIDAWSLAHPRHVPILILINAKDSGVRLPGAAAVAPFDAAAFDALDAEIARVFAKERLITPDEVQGTHATLRDAVRAGAWPTLDRARGRLLFALDEAPDKVARYRGTRRSLEDRLMFVNIEESSPAAAYITLNDPMADRARITSAVQQGLLVRTRADADTREARANDVRRRDAAFASGAQYISTDYMQPDVRFGSYAVRLPAEAVSTANVISAPACASHRIE